jgi:L-rhamnose isomerase
MKAGAGNEAGAGFLPTPCTVNATCLSDSQTLLALAEEATAGKLPHDQAARAVRKLTGKAKEPASTMNKTIFGADGWTVIVSAPRKRTYDEIEQVLSLALGDVRHRIDSGRQFF